MLYLLTALPAEGRPLREAFRLEARPESPAFAHYVGEGVELLTTGIGKTAMAAGCGWLAAHAKAAGLWLNVGIAGHAELPLGSALLAHQVIDRATGRTFYPPLVFEPPCATGTVETVDRPELDYPRPHAYDMEASAFLEIGQKMQHAELVQVLKVVSDRSREDIASLDRQGVSRRIESLLPQIESLRQAVAPLLTMLEQTTEEMPAFAELCASRHFTFSDRVALRRLLRRKEALVGEQALPEEVLAAERGRELNRRLATWLSSLPLRFGGAA